MSNKVVKYKKVIWLILGIISLPIISLVLKYCFYGGLLVGKYLRFL